MGTTDTHKSKANWCLNTNRKRNQTEPQIKLKFQKNGTYDIVRTSLHIEENGEELQLR